MLLTTVDVAGLRIAEPLALNVTDIDIDIDSRALTVLVTRGKGNKQCLIRPAPTLLEELRAWWRTPRHPQWILPDTRFNWRVTATWLKQPANMR